ncbi:MAG: tetratricopeptide repeat protein [bacterium]
MNLTNKLIINLVFIIVSAVIVIPVPGKKQKTTDYEIMGSRANYLFKQGELSDALSHYKVAFRLAAQYDNRTAQAKYLNNIGVTLFRLGLIEQAMNSMSKSLAIFNTIQNSSGKASCLANICRIHLKLSNHQEFNNTFEEAAKLADENKIKEVKGILTTLRARAALAKGSNDKVLESCNEAENIFKKQKNNRGLASCLVLRARYLLKTDRGEEAIGQAQKALVLSREISDKYYILGSLKMLADIYKKLNNQEKLEDIENRLAPLYAATGISPE